MSAICGLLYKKDICNAEDITAVMDSLGKYNFDNSGVYQEDSIFLGCHIAHVVPESLSEILPYDDKKSSYVITADAIIDNREELFDLMDIPEKDRNMPDSLVILEAYKRWGISCTDQLVGDFSFVIWDKKEQELFCVRDHVGCRPFYYYNSNEIFAFSTLMEPLLHINGIRKELNDVYIADFLSHFAIRHEIDAGITIYKDVIQLPAAHAMLINREGIRQWRYWSVRKTKEIHFATDEEYEKAFLDIYSEAVTCRLRSVKKVGIMLSGGLDSGSIACIAAEELKKRDEILYSFTQIPMEGYRDYLPAGKLADEREFVQEICEFAGNINPSYIRSEGRSSLTEIDARIAFLEQPYKSIENSYWIHAIHKAAAAKGVGVLLTGQSGNATVSWGNFRCYSKYLVKNLKFKTLNHEMKYFTGHNRFNSLKQFVKIMLSFLPYPILRIMHAKKGINHKFPFILNKELFKEMRIYKRARQLHYDAYHIKQNDSFGERLNLLNEAGLSYLGAVGTKTAMAYGIVKRDPTRDKRVIEFCINLPEDQWVRNGMERRLIRCAMNGKMPDKVRTNAAVRGSQAADWVQRIIPKWDQVWEELNAVGDLALERKYLDIPKIKQLLNDNKQLHWNDYKAYSVKYLLRVLVFSRFLRRK